MNRIRKWWKSISHFISASFGMLWAIYGVRRLTFNDGILLGSIAIGAGVTIAFIALTTKKCQNCGSSSPFARIWDSVYEHQQFVCHICRTRYIMPAWNRAFFYAILLGWFVVFMASAFNWLKLDILTVGIDGMVLSNALLLLLVRLSRYERQDKV